MSEYTGAWIYQLRGKLDEARSARNQWKSRSDAHEQNFNEMLKRVDQIGKERDQWRECAEKMAHVLNTLNKQGLVAGRPLIAQFNKLKEGAK